MSGNILSALKKLDPAGLSYQEWLNVGFALHSEGFDWKVWDDWSRADRRYKPGECERKWNGFRGSVSPVTGGTIVQMAKDRGWTPYGEDGIMNWDDVISDDGDRYMPTKPVTYSAVNDLITYLKILFKPEERVGYVTNDVWKDADGEWAPGRGVFDRTAGELIESLERHPDDLGATVGDWKPECGAWIRFNPVDGQGVRNENVTAYRFALVESDKIPIPEQETLYRQLELPIACLVNSGGKSLHAIVRVDADNAVEYRKRVDFLYSYLEDHGLPVDRQNRNESRLSRMPGVTRNGNRQYLVGTNIGRRSWADWLDYVEGAEDTLPEMESLADFRENRPALPEELIAGVLRRGHKMLISGSSKAGKSFLLMELCIAIASGTRWLGFDCRKGRVLYVNLEIDRASAIDRFMKIYAALDVDISSMENITLWNLRGHAVPLDKLVPKLIRRIKGQHYDAVVIDPIYKVITGDENNASDMGAFCNQFDRICTETGSSAIYCHHHSKGAQGMKKAMDRASGSGVFARDPDAQLDIINLELTDDITSHVQDGNSTGWRLESSLREFPNFYPVNFWFEYPIHRIDSSGALQNAHPEGSAKANLARSGKRSSAEERKDGLDRAFEICAEDGFTRVEDIADYLGIDPKTVRRHLKEFSSFYLLDRGIVTIRKAENDPDTDETDKRT